MTKPAHSRKPKLAEVKPIGTLEDVVELLSQLLCEAQDDAILAIGAVVVYRQGDVTPWSAGAERGFRHLLIAGCKYLADDLCQEE